MIKIDGSIGEGGGQILRTSLSLSVITGQPVQIENIRAKRNKPGLLRQHLTALNSLSVISNANVTGNEIGSMSLAFEPKNITTGNFNFPVGSAGSTTLIFQTIFPVLMRKDAISNIIFEGGTHNPNAPSFDYVKNVFLPIVSKIGFQAKVEFGNYGFYPAGGGKWNVLIEKPKTLKPIELTKRGNLISNKVEVLHSNLDPKISIKQAKLLHSSLEKDLRDDIKIISVNSDGPGNIIQAYFDYDNIDEMFLSFGIKALPSFKVVKDLIYDINKFTKSEAVVSKYLADQLLLPMSLGEGGIFTTLKPTKHTLTNIEIIKKFINIKISTKEIKQDLWEIEIHK